MLHKFFEPGDWFAPKRYGYGAGMPIAWQGWVLLVGYIVLVTGLALLPTLENWRITVVAMVLILLATVGLILIVSRRTKGGFRWRWGGGE